MDLLLTRCRVKLTLTNGWMTVRTLSQVTGKFGVSRSKSSRMCHCQLRYACCHVEQFAMQFSTSHKYRITYRTHYTKHSLCIFLHRNNIETLCSCWSVFKMRFVFTSLLLVAAVATCSAQIDCNVNDSNQRPLKCVLKSETSPFANRCATCTKDGVDYGLGPCNAATQCDGVKANCENLVKGTFSLCPSNGCNKCTSPGSLPRIGLLVGVAAFCAVLLM